MMRYAILIATTLLLLTACSSKLEYPEDCLMGVVVEYSFNQTVTDVTEARALAETFATSGTGSLIDEHPRMSITDVAYGRAYEGKDYWTATFSYSAGEERGNAQFHVSEDGEIVRLLGCI